MWTQWFIFRNNNFDADDDNDDDVLHTHIMEFCPLLLAHFWTGIAMICDVGSLWSVMFLELNYAGRQMVSSDIVLFCFNKYMYTKLST